MDIQPGRFKKAIMTLAFPTKVRIYFLFQFLLNVVYTKVPLLSASAQ
jgi:hypothetical protein